MDDFSSEQMLQQGIQLIAGGRPKEAVESAFDLLIRIFEEEFGDKPLVYSPRSLKETISYLSEAAAAGADAISVTPIYGYSYFYKAYALNEMSDFEGAGLNLNKAIQLAPNNAQFLGEKGHVLAIARSYKESLEVFRRAAIAARDFSPDEVKIHELCRALRGQGFALIELGELAQAEKIYLECLSQNPADATAAAQLGYVRGLQGGFAR
jgi:tetratricopeptide (TPR) repeat protein